jgi:hypothetical protein
MISKSADGAVLGLEGPFATEEEAMAYALEMFNTFMEGLTPITMDDLEDPPPDVDFGVNDSGREGGWEIYCDSGSWAVETATQPHVAKVQQDDVILIFEPSEDIDRSTEYTGSPALIYGFYHTHEDAEEKGQELKAEFPDANIYYAQTKGWIADQQEAAAS